MVVFGRISYVTLIIYKHSWNGSLLKKSTLHVNCSLPFTPLPVSDYLAITSAPFLASDGTNQAART